MDLKKNIEELIAPALADMGYDIVRVKLDKGRRKSHLQVMAEPSDGREMAVEDCEKISHTVSALLDVEEGAGSDTAIPGAYELEVSSPGIDRPLVRPKDFRDYAGHEVKLVSEFPVDGRRRFRGVLKGLEGEQVLLELPEEGETVSLPLEQVVLAQLVLTDALIKEYQSLRKAKAGEDAPALAEA